MMVYISHEGYVMHTKAKGLYDLWLTNFNVDTLFGSLGEKRKNKLSFKKKKKG